MTEFEPKTGGKCPNLTRNKPKNTKLDPKLVKNDSIGPKNQPNVTNLTQNKLKIIKFDSRNAENGQKGVFDGNFCGQNR